MRAAAEADIIVTFYNPRSRGRDWQLPKALGILAEHREPGTPVGVVRNASRPDESARLSTLGELDPGRRHDDGRDGRQHRDPGHRGPHGDSARLPLAAGPRRPSEPRRPPHRAGVVPAAPRPPGHLALRAADPGGRGAGHPLRGRPGVRDDLVTDEGAWSRPTRRCTRVRPSSWTWRWSPRASPSGRPSADSKDAESGPGLTRSAHAIRLAYEQVGPGALWVIGCAPTALEELLDPRRRARARHRPARRLRRRGRVQGGAARERAARRQQRIREGRFGGRRGRAQRPSVPPRAVAEVDTAVAVAVDVLRTPATTEEYP